MNLKEAKSGVFQFTVMFQSIQKCISKNKNVYTRIDVRDREDNTAVIYDWNSIVPDMTKVPVLMDVSVEATERNGQVFLDLKQCAPSKDQNSMIEYFPPAKIDRKVYAREFCDYAAMLSPEAAELVKQISRNHSTEFTRLPLSEDGPFSRTSGILEATVRLVRLVQGCAGEFDYLDRNLLVCGALLYYMGYTNLMDSSFTCRNDSILTGPGLETYNMIREYGDKSGCSQYFIRDLCHIVMSRRGEGIPVIGEAILLNRLSQTLLAMDEIHSASLGHEKDDVFQVGRNRYFNRIQES